MAKKNQTNYYESFVTLGEMAVRASQLLCEALEDFDVTTISEYIVRMHDIENAADKYRHGIMEAVAKEFITPIEREDIVSMADRLDDVVDTIEDVLIRLYICNIQQMRPDAVEFGGLVRNCAQVLVEGVRTFEQFQKKGIAKALIDINAAEEAGDRLYLQATHALYRSDLSPVEIYSWAQVYDQLEQCCDCAERVAEVMEMVVLKNS